jgi:protein-S-isoprenylcysteine O-methyltransferase Ste14
MRPIDRLVGFLVKRSQKEYKISVRTLAVTLGGMLFIAGIPAFILWAGKLFPAGLFLSVSWAKSASLICFIIGTPWMLSAIFWQLVYGQGTPVPIVPTKHFLQKGPYRHVRNPMMMGFFLYILGWAFLSNRWSALAAAFLVVGLLLMEIKFIEEHELEKRFGNAYREYKKETPFILPGSLRKK